MPYPTLSPRGGHPSGAAVPHTDPLPRRDADALSATPTVHTSEVGKITVYASGIAHAQIATDYWVRQEHVASMLDWLNETVPAGAPLLIDRRSSYSLDFGAQQAITELLYAPAVAILVGDIQQISLAEYSRETYLRKVNTRIFRSEAHALRWLSTYCDDPLLCAPHEFIAASAAELRAVGGFVSDSDE